LRGHIINVVVAGYDEFFACTIGRIDKSRCVTYISINHKYIDTTRKALAFNEKFVFLTKNNMARNRNLVLCTFCNIITPKC